MHCCQAMNEKVIEVCVCVCVSDLNAIMYGAFVPLKVQFTVYTVCLCMCVSAYGFKSPPCCVCPSPRHWPVLYKVNGKAPGCAQALMSIIPSPCHQEEKRNQTVCVWQDGGGGVNDVSFPADGWLPCQTWQPCSSYFISTPLLCLPHCNFREHYHAAVRGRESISGK